MTVSREAFIKLAQDANATRGTSRHLDALRRMKLAELGRHEERVGKPTRPTNDATSNRLFLRACWLRDEISRARSNRQPELVEALSSLHKSAHEGFTLRQQQLRKGTVRASMAEAAPSDGTAADPKIVEEAARILKALYQGTAGDPVKALAQIGELLAKSGLPPSDLEQIQTLIQDAIAAAEAGTDEDLATMLDLVEQIGELLPFDDFDSVRPRNAPDGQTSMRVYAALRARMRLAERSGDREQMKVMSMTLHNYECTHGLCECERSNSAGDFSRRKELVFGESSKIV